MVGNDMVEGRFLHLDPAPRLCINMGSTAKKEMQGPSRCVLCREQVEKMEHMTNACKYSDNLWKQHNQLFGVSDRNPKNIKTTIDNW